ncbi:hypothetical protein B7982_14680 [Fibrobacter sp. UWB2]|nr:hypothetical protein B7982_14680 [Fibrobacter sp. UWB2]
MLGVRVSLAPEALPGASQRSNEVTENIEISAWKLTKQSSIQSDLKHQEKNRWIRAAHAAEQS